MLVTFQVILQALISIAMKIYEKIVYRDEVIILKKLGRKLSNTFFFYYVNSYVQFLFE